MRQEEAETLAFQALGWIIGEDDLRDVFLGATGADPEALRTQAQEPEFQASVLNFLMMDDAWVIRFCDQAGCAYEDPARAVQALPGQALPHWT